MFNKKGLINRENLEELQVLCHDPQFWVKDDSILVSMSQLPLLYSVVTIYLYLLLDGSGNDVTLCSVVDLVSG